jgi:hypothetical protein
MDAATASGYVRRAHELHSPALLVISTVRQRQLLANLKQVLGKQTAEVTACDTGH